MTELVQIDSSRKQRYRDSRLEVEFHTQAAVVDGKLVELTNLEYRLLAMLAENAGEVVPRASLLMTVWGYGPNIRTRTLDVHIRRLRSKLGNTGRQQIETIFGIGYRLQPWSDRSAPPVVTQDSASFGLSAA